MAGNTPNKPDQRREDPNLTSGSVRSGEGPVETEAVDMQTSAREQDKVMQARAKDQERARKDLTKAEAEVSKARVAAEEARFAVEDEERTPAQRKAREAQNKVSDAEARAEEARRAVHGSGAGHTLADAKAIAAPLRGPGRSAGDHMGQKFGNDPENPKPARGDHADPEKATEKLERVTPDSASPIVTWVHPDMVGDYLRAGWTRSAGA